ncbi:thymidylate kinase-like [Argonauta hians]
MSGSLPDLHRGQLIVFEGIDRCGKTTQCFNLKDALEAEGRSAVVYKFPKVTTLIGKLINKYLRKDIHLPDEAAHLLFSANRWECMNEIQKLLQSGITVVMDRYAYSGVCYSAAKETRTDNLQQFSHLWCKAPDRGIIEPDCVFFLDISPTVASTRPGFGEERYEVLEFQELVRKQFMKIVDPTWKILDAARSEEVLAEEIMRHVSKVNNKHLRKLWIDDFYVPCETCLNRAPSGLKDC